MAALPLKSRGDVPTSPRMLADEIRRRVAVARSVTPEPLTLVLGPDLADKVDCHGLVGAEALGALCDELGVAFREGGLGRCMVVPHSPTDDELWGAPRK